MTSDRALSEGATKRVDSGTDGLPWAEAEAKCKTEGADLASVTSAYENISGSQNTYL